MKKLAFVLLTTCCLPLTTSAMTRFADGSIMLDPAEVQNVENNFNQMQQTIEDAAEIIQKLLEENEALKGKGKCI